MKHTHFKLLASLVALSTLGLSAHTFRFCNMGPVPVTVGINYWACGNPAPVQIQPGQSYDFEKGCDMKGAWFGSDNAAVTESVTSDGDDFYEHSSHSSSNTLNLSQSPDGTWFLAAEDKLIDCATPAPQSTDTSSSDSSDSSDSSNSQASSDLSSTLSSWTSGGAAAQTGVVSATGTDTSADGTTGSSSCVCTVGGQANQPPPTGVDFANGDCTQPTMGGISASAILSCTAAPASGATASCACTVGGQTNQAPPTGVTFANGDCTQPTLGGESASAFLSCYTSGSSASSSTSTISNTSSSDGGLDTTSGDASSSASSSTSGSTGGTSGFPSGFGSGS